MKKQAKEVSAEPGPTVSPTVIGRQQSFLKLQPLEVPSLMNNVVSVFVQGIPRDSYNKCGIEITESASTLPQGHRQKLSDFVRGRLELLARLEYASWINGQIPFVTSRELQLWRLLQFIRFIWFWDLPDDDILALIFNATSRRASSLASDFEARFRKTILYPVALRRLYELFSTEPAKSNAPHPRQKKWDGCLYRVHSDRFLSYTVTLVEDLREAIGDPLPDPTWWDKDERLMWLPMEVRDIAISDVELRDRLFQMYDLPGDNAAR